MRKTESIMLSEAVRIIAKDVLTAAQAVSNGVNPLDNSVIAGCLNEAADRIIELHSAIAETIEENLHLADGDDCTLIKLKRALEA